MNVFNLQKESKSEVLVSIVCFAFNHEEFLADAIEGFLSQRVNFGYEIIINDDASTDSTAEMIRGYEKKFPGIIRGIYQDTNQYNTRGALRLKDIYVQCCGKYIAICEGDDYWMDCNKLQIQVDYLEKYEDCMLVMHDGIKIDCRDGTVKAMSPYDTERDLSAGELILQRLTPTASYVCRRSLADIDSFFLEYGFGDYPTQLYCFTKGKVHYFDRIMSAYRYMHQGSWTKSTQSNRLKQIVHYFQMLNFLKKYNEYTKSKYSKFIISKSQDCVEGVLKLMKTTNESELKQIRHCCSEIESYKNYLHEIDRIHVQINDKKYLDETVKTMHSRFKYTVIMGAGNYASIVAKQMWQHGIEFEGFAVSSPEEEGQSYMGKPVWSLNSLPFNSDEIGIIIAIKPVIWHEIIESLEKNGRQNWCCPYLMREYQNW